MRKIAVIPGDGIGPEVTREGLKVLQFVNDRSGLGLEFVAFDWGADTYLETGVSLPAGTLEDLRRNYAAVYLGAIGDPRVPFSMRAASIKLTLRATSMSLSSKSMQASSVELTLQAHSMSLSSIGTGNAIEIDAGFIDRTDTASNFDVALIEIAMQTASIELAPQAARCVSRRSGRQCLPHRCRPHRFRVCSHPS